MKYAGTLTVHSRGAAGRAGASAVRREEGTAPARLPSGLSRRRPRPRPVPFCLPGRCVLCAPGPICLDSQHRSSAGGVRCHAWREPSAGCGSPARSVRIPAGASRGRGLSRRLEPESQHRGGQLKYSDQKRKLRLYISNTFNPAKSDADDSDGSIASWELRVEGKLLDDLSKQKRKFSSFFKSLVIELDKDLYGPDNHLVEWHRTPTTQETDGFQVKRPGDVSVRCTLLLMLDYQPPQFKLDPRLARLLGIHTQTRSAIIQALWQYIKTNKLQDSHDKEYINCDKYFQQIFDCPRLKFSEIPQRLTNLLLPPDPIVINHIISVDPNDQKKTACYDIDVEVEDPLKGQMSSFLLSTANQQEITALDNKIHETIESINQLKIQRDFMLSFSKDPKGYIQDLLRSQSRDLKVMTDVVGNPEEERRAEFYHEPWSQEAVSRYFYCKIQQRRQELEQSLGVRNT
ncbi:SWI/SNF-related matrix-associated actin-dependent regulator of chromatin subfamily D member 3 isoform X5 [Columba livia]|uniref:SWI/SNF-related matrix-associated actin-dependent regulator of chromatin subfamily D member 3 isoform X5 n=1 Tax=Columba livia TaxID=8932 RepID=UPI0031BBAF16